MWTFPVFLDRIPDVTAAKGRAGSTLLAPLGDDVVLNEMRRRFARITGAQPVVVTPFEPDERYIGAIREACPDVEAVEHFSAFEDRLYSYQPSDRLLLVDAGCFVVEADDPGLRAFASDDDPRTIKHLLAPARGSEGTTEYVDADADGRIRLIQRYFDAVSSPYAAGVAASLIPVAILRAARERPLGALGNLRLLLSSDGVATRDVVLNAGAVDLRVERNLLAVNEAAALRLAGAGRRDTRKRSDNGRDGVQPVARGARIHATAQLIGPVVVHEGAEIDAGTTVIGPAVIGRGARVEAGATVAQSVVGAGQIVRARETLRHRVVLAEGPPVTGAPSPHAETDPADADADVGWEPLLVAGLAAERPADGSYQTVKRAIDIGGAAIALALLSPFWILLALLIKLDSPGPVFFRHEREGMGGRRFACLKFRTMVPDADHLQRKLARMNAVDGPQFKIEGDPRRTRLGRILSNTNLDELPQLWNVLRGDMSLVGPRPSPFRENQVCVPWRAGRLSVRPGMTGVWQICRHDREHGDFHQWIHFDLLYVRHMSFLLDLKIILLTPVSLLRRGYIPVGWLVPDEDQGSTPVVGSPLGTRRA